MIGGAAASPVTLAAARRTWRGTRAIFLRADLLLVASEVKQDEPRHRQSRSRRVSRLAPALRPSSSNTSSAAAGTGLDSLRITQVTCRGEKVSATAKYLNFIAAGSSAELSSSRVF